MTAKQVIKLLEQNGWILHSTEGSHRRYKHENNPIKVTVPYHKGDIKPKTLHAILKQAGLK